MTADPFHPATLAAGAAARRRIAELGVTGSARDEVYAIPPTRLPGYADDLALAWRGRARMAHARQAAGAELDHIDLEAIRRHPTCPPLLEP